MNFETIREIAGVARYERCVDFGNPVLDFTLIGLIVAIIVFSGVVISKIKDNKKVGENKTFLLVNSIIMIVLGALLIITILFKAFMEGL